MLKCDVKRMFFSDIILRARPTGKLAYLAVMTAFTIVSNMFFEFRFFDVQYSLTITVSFVMGVLLGAIPGFAVCVLGDFIGYVFNSWGQLYMPWVGLSTGIMAFICGIIVNGVQIKCRMQLFIKLALACVLSLFICTIGINSTGFYFYNKAMGFSTAVMDYVAQRFGRGVDYVGYLFYRLFFKGQIFNNLANYAVIFLLIPIMLKNKFFGDRGLNQGDESTCDEK